MTSIFFIIPPRDLLPLLSTNNYIIHFADDLQDIKKQRLFLGIFVKK